MRELFQSNFALKILSLILAALLWFTIESSVQRKARLSASLLGEAATLDLTCPVAGLVPPGITNAFEITPPEVVVKLAGSPEVLGEITGSHVPVFVRVPSKLTAEVSVLVQASPPSAVRLIEIDPPQVSVKPSTPE